MMMLRCEQWLWRLAILTLPLGTMWMFSFGGIGGTPWAMGNLGIGVGECFVVLALVLAGLRGGMRFPRYTFLLALAWLGLLFGRGFATTFPAAATIHVARYALAVLMLVTTIPLSSSEIRKWWGVGMMIPCLLALLEVFAWHNVPASTLFGLASHPLLSPGTSVIEVAGERFMRAYGSFPHPNIFGAYLALSIGILWRDAERYSSALLFVVSFCLALTFSRAAVLALIVFMIVSVCLHGTKEPSSGRVRFRRVAVPFIGLLFGILLFLPAYGVRIGHEHGRLEVKSADARVASLRDGWKLFLTQPLVGVGVLQSVPVLVATHVGSSVWDFEPAHALPMLMLAEWGVLGVVLFVTLLMLLLAPLSPIFLFLAPLVVLGLFDHALLTSPQLVMLVPLALQIARNRYVES